jgi:3-oxoacyl-[acyl-carrier protein] reductase
VARAFTPEGASVFLAGRTEQKLNSLADENRSYGEKAEISKVDALDEDAVNQFVRRVIKQTRQIDIAFTVVS